MWTLIWIAIIAVFGTSLAMFIKELINNLRKDKYEEN